MSRPKVEKAQYKIREDYRDVIVKGLVIPNYKKLCELLNEEEKTSNSQKAQFKEWDRYFKYEKQGQKFIITEVYETLLTKVKDLREDNDNEGAYASHIEAILLNLLTEDTVTYSMVEWLTYIGVYNSKYSLFKMYEDRKYGFAHSKLIPVNEIEDFMTKISKNLGDSFKTVLTKLEKRCLITARNVIQYKDSWDADAILYTATQQEYDEYRDIVYDELKKYSTEKYKVEEEHDLFGLRNEDNSMFNVKIYWDNLAIVVNTQMGWANHFRAIEITSKKSHVQDYKTRHKLQDEIKSLNEVVSIEALKQAMTRHEKNIEYTAESDAEDSLFEVEDLNIGVCEPKKEMTEYEWFEFKKSDRQKMYKTFGNAYFYGTDKYIEHIEKIIKEIIIIDENGLDSVYKIWGIKDYEPSTIVIDVEFKDVLTTLQPPMVSGL